MHFFHSPPLKLTDQPQPHTIDDVFLIPDATKDEVRLAQLQVIVLPLLVDTKFHSNPNLRTNSFKADNTYILPTINIQQSESMKHEMVILLQNCYNTFFENLRQSFDCKIVYSE